MTQVDLRTRQEEVQQFWNSAPCDSGLSSQRADSVACFEEIERHRFALQPHIPRILEKIDWQRKSVLEIGTGVGTDARRIIRAGGDYTGINVDRGSVEMTARAISVFNLSGSVVQADATATRFADHAFDVVYSFGVLHHIPDVDKAIREIERILKPGGELLIMLYNRSSINYQVEIRCLRRIALKVMLLPGVIPLLGLLGFPRDKLARHAELYRASRSISADEWLSRNTDGPDNPYSRVYGAEEAERLLSRFELVGHEVYFFDPRHWGPLGRLLPRSLVRALGTRWGWHRIVHARKPV